MASVILLHKAPAIWEVECKGKRGITPKFTSEFTEIKNPTKSESEFLSSMEQDLFFLFAKSVAKYLEISDIHVILCHDSKEKRNWEVIERNGVIRSDGGFVFWSSNSLNMMPEISDADVMIVRGNYPNLHNKLMTEYSPRCTIFYPATSLFFPHFDIRMNNWIESLIDGTSDFDEIMKVYSRLNREAIFSRIKEPKLRKPKSKSEDIEIRKLVRNYCLECIKIAKGVRSRVSPGNYPIVLFDEENNLDTLEMKYPNSTLLKFNKAPSPVFEIDLKANRDIDILFTGTTIQRTKNPHLFYEIVDQLLEIRPESKVAIVGVEDGLEDLENRWSTKNIEVFGRISKEELCRLYNRSKFHMITSGRDCFPRTIPESICCGCHNIVLDILSDGLSIIAENPIIGTVIDTTDCIPILEPSYSISVILQSDFVKSKLIETIETQHDHFSIATLGRNLLSLEKMVQLDRVWESIDLNSLNHPNQISYS